MKPIKTAIIGVGHDHADPIIKRVKGEKELFDVAGYFIPEEEKGRFDNKIQLFEGLNELTLDEIMQDSSIEAVVIESEDLYLTKYAKIAADSGKHMHMDKPGSGNLAEFEALIDAVKRNNVVFSTGYMYRFNPCVIDLKEQIARGELGEIINIEAQMNCIHPKEKRQWLKTYPGGMMHFLGCHLVDLIYSIQGEPQNVIALSRSTGLDGVTGDDFGMAIFEYENGVSFAKTTAVEYGGFDRRQFAVVGSKKTVELKPFEQYDERGQMFTKCTEYREWNWRNRGETEKHYFDRYENMLKSFAAYVRGEKQNPVTPDYELRLYRLILSACGS